MNDGAEEFKRWVEPSPPHEYAATLELSVAYCWFCQRSIRWGLTINGRRAPFDPDTERNHWITCPRGGAAREMYPRKRKEGKVGRNLAILRSRQAGHTFAAIGSSFDITRQRAEQIVKGFPKVRGEPSQLPP